MDQENNSFLKKTQKQFSKKKERTVGKPEADSLNKGPDTGNDH